ncbi:hypothetical protein OSTOST_08130 [Ostertagia ostertagi]
MHSKLFNTVNSVHRAYETTKLYRELKMRGAIVDESFNLKLLPLEQLVEKVNGVWNLSTDQGTLGCFVITNVRLVWFASTNSLYNVSVPYLQLYSCRIRESKFGLALVIETTTQSGEYVLGFRIDPAERLQQVCKAIQALHKSSNTRPIYGVTFHKDKPMSELLSLEDRISPNLAVLFSLCPNVDDKLFLAALEWGVARYRKTHYIRRRRFKRIPAVPAEYFTDPARLKTIRFHYVEDQPLEKAADLSLDSRVRADEDSYHRPTKILIWENTPCKHARLLASFSREKRRSVVSIPYSEDLLDTASFFTKHVFILDNDGNLKNVLG